MIERISAEQAKEKLDAGWAYLDVRSIPEFEQGHPAGAYNVPLLHMGPAGSLEPNPTFIDVVSAHFPKEAKLVIGCKSGVRSLRAAQMLAGAGYTSVVDQRAGFSGARNAFGQVTDKGWEAAGLPSSASAEPGRSYAELTRASR